MDLRHTVLIAAIGQLVLFLFTSNTYAAVTAANLFVVLLFDSLFGELNG